MSLVWDNVNVLGRNNTLISSTLEPWSWFKTVLCLLFSPAMTCDNRYLDVSAPADIIAVSSRGNQHDSMDNY